MDNLRTHQQQHLRSIFVSAFRDGVRKFDFLGGRRSGKTYFILQRLLGYMAQGDVVSVATMTDTQGRLGAYQDACDIVQMSDIDAWCEVLKTPREIRCLSGGRMFFNSYSDSERAKGIACDWLYINEANNFSEQQYIDLSASVRKGVFADRNPNTDCWTERNGFTMLHSTWKDNADNLTQQQLEWFEGLKQKAESPDATAADIAFYRMYYLGEYAEIVGDIFTPANLQVREIDCKRLYNFAIVCDPSNLSGVDYFPSVVVATDGAYMYVVDTYSINTSDTAAGVEDWAGWCKRWKPILEKWQEWVRIYDVRMIFAECNGVGAEFLRYVQSERVPNVKPYTNSRNKHARILENYENICGRVVWNDTGNVQEYLRQVYEYSGKDDPAKHDDNIDCVSSAFDIYYKKTRFMH